MAVGLSLMSSDGWSQTRCAATGASEKRVALVVGNSAYRFVGRLDNPKNDARLVAQTLQGLGFNLIGGGPQLDLNKEDFDRAVLDFNQILGQGADVALFYYAGHGVQARGTNWLLPTTANPNREIDVEFQAIDAQQVLRVMESGGTRLNMLILDACRNNPLAGRGLRAVSGGLAQMQAPEGSLIVYSTQPGNTAMDGADGNSPFTRALAQTMRRPGLDVFRLFNEVGLEVKRSTSGAQQPWVSSSPIDGDFYFSGPPAATVAVSPPVVDRDRTMWLSIEGSFNPTKLHAYVDEFPNGRYADTARKRLVAVQDKTFWDGVKDSSQPAELQAYIEQFPNGTYVGLARAKLSALTSPAPSVGGRFAAFDGRYQATFTIDGRTVNATLGITGTQLSGTGFASGKINLYNGGDSGVCALTGTVNEAGVLQRLRMNCGMAIDVYFTGQFTRNADARITAETTAGSSIVSPVPVHWAPAS